MIVLRADAMGMCFGVRDALAVIQGVASPEQVTIHGELVHNEAVLRDLDARGFHRSPEGDRPVPSTPAVLVTAHGISNRERTRLLEAGKQLVDTTCPLVQKAHDHASRLQAEGRRVVVIGRLGHVEVQGIIEDLDRPIVVGSEADVRNWPERRLGVLCQTTTREDDAERLLAAIRRANPEADIAFADTICSPTKARVTALHDLLPRIDALIVVGGANSNNTAQLVRRAESQGVPALRVQDPADLDPAFLKGRRVIGLTAGTSALPLTIDAVHRALLAFAAAPVPQPG
jgi:4-hydroxy-3-methylbut-2-en-1-yl diphosphate reductase